MIFSSVIFISFFLPSVLIIYWLTPWRFKNLVLLLSSVLFYCWGEGVRSYVFLFSICLQIGAGALISRYPRVGLTLGISLNLLLLAFFKYGNFIYQTAQPLLNLDSGTRHLANISLPLGISFFTFHGISYLIDLYRSDAKQSRRLSDIALYIAFFPQLIAGPIVRYKDIADQFVSRTLSLATFNQGVSRFIIGLSKKLLLANPLAVLADRIFLIAPVELSTPIAWLGIICYTLQIYFDFSGYSDMAIGLARMFGFSFPENFRYPYSARSVTDFWKRWHISLSTWFRDYLYIPLGGNRGSRFRTYFNLICVFLLCGLWHGAAWNFIIWGIWHGSFLVFERISNKKFGQFYCLLVVMLGWVLFRSPDLNYAASYIITLFSFGFDAEARSDVLLLLTPEIITTILLGIVAASSLPAQLLSKIQQFHKGTCGLLTYSQFAAEICLLIVCLATLASGSYNPFIYFRF